MTQQTAMQDDRRQPELINVRRNPYLVDYEEQLRFRKAMGQEHRLQPPPSRGARRNAGTRQTKKSQARHGEAVPSARSWERYGEVVSGAGGQDHRPGKAVSSANARARRRKIVRRQRLAVGLWILCILLLSITFLTRNSQSLAAKQENRPASAEPVGGEADQPDPVMIQGLPAAVYAAHPQWTENFLTPNEYSRPGDPLEEVTSIFVHYTANAGTSAAQNRSYFEQQKDVKERSVSAHFIIGYEGEIIQCVPLDEIAYAVQTRNMDSVSIECCFLADDGSFTQATYDSLISLLAWLTEAYDLSTDDILRHYDCGGKKCPLYYTENPSEWEKLKEDVAGQLDQM